MYRISIANQHELLKANQVQYYKLAQLIYKKKTVYKYRKNATAQPYRLIQQNRRTPRLRTNCGKLQLNYQITKLLNLLNNAIDFSLPFMTFKTQVRIVLINRNISVVQAGQQRIQSSILRCSISHLYDQSDCISSAVFLCCTARPAFDFFILFQ